MPKKYLELTSAGKVQEASPIDSSAGSEDAGKLIATGADGYIDPSLLPPGVGADSQVMPASENLAANDLVNVYDDSGTTKCRKADASTPGKEANGFVKTSVSMGANATVYFEQKQTGLSEVTGGADYYLSTTPGLATTTAPTGSGNVVQYIGRGLSSTSRTFQPGTPFIRA